MSTGLVTLSTLRSTVSIEGVREGSGPSLVVPKSRRKMIGRHRDINPICSWNPERLMCELQSAPTLGHRGNRVEIDGTVMGKLGETRELALAGRRICDQVTWDQKIRDVGHSVSAEQESSGVE